MIDSMEFDEAGSMGFALRGASGSGRSLTAGRLLALAFVPLLAAGAGAASATQSATQKVVFNWNNLSVNENASAGVEATVLTRPPPPHDLTVTLEVVDGGSATLNEDYTIGSDGLVLTLPASTAGVFSTDSAHFYPTCDQEVESTETFTVRIVSVSPSDNFSIDPSRDELRIAILPPFCNEEPCPCQ